MNRLIASVLLALCAARHPQVRRQGRITPTKDKTESSSLQKSSSSRSFTKLTTEYPFYHSSQELLQEARQLVSGCESASFQTIQEGDVSMDVVMVNSTRSAEQARNKVFILFGEHSRELISPETGLALLRELCEGTGLSKDVRKDSEFLLVLNGNPRSRPGVERGDYCLRTNPKGVDLNRNWDEEWQKDASTHGKDTNPGPAPFSEPETRLLRTLVSEYKPTTYLCVHSGTLGLYMPWAFDQLHEADRNQNAMMSILKELDESHCQCPYGAAGKEVGYSCPGTSLDWIYDKLKTPYAFAFEIFVGKEQMSTLKERWKEQGTSMQSHLADARPDFFKAHPSDFVQVSQSETETMDSRDCFEQYNPANEELFHATVKNWVAVYLEMAQKVSKSLQDEKGT